MYIDESTAGADASVVSINTHCQTHYHAYSTDDDTTVLYIDTSRTYKLIHHAVTNLMNIWQQSWSIYSITKRTVPIPSSHNSMNKKTVMCFVH